MNAARRGARSLHRQLLLWLLLPQVVLWAAAALFAYNLAGRYANEAIDASLVQAARALARQIKPTATGLFVDLPRSAQEILEADPSDRVLYSVSSPPGKFLLGDPYLPQARIDEPRLGEPYFYNTHYVGAPDEGGSGRRESIRVVAMVLRFDAEGTRGGTMLVQVARSTTNREQLARNILVDTALPLTLVVALMSLVVWAGIRAGLRPLFHLRRQVEGRAANALAPIELRAAPPEVRSLAGAINALLERERSHIQAQKRFISDAAHQLRTPLAGLKSQTELALAEAQEPALVERLRRVHASAQRSAHMVSQLLALARAEPDSEAALLHGVLNLNTLAAELTAEWVPRALALGADLGFDECPEADEAAVAVRGNAILLGEAVGNLIDNAVRYAGPRPTVTVRVRREAAKVVLEVEDNGPGIPEADRERMFERFVRAGDDPCGCGLGLAIVREVVQRHGGEVALRAAQPRGLVARITLPMAGSG